jgi:hypothetical protein
VERVPAEGETRFRVHCAADGDVAEEIFRLAVQSGWILRELSRETVSLEDVFVRLTHRDEAVPAAEEVPAPATPPTPEGGETA